MVLAKRRYSDRMSSPVRHHQYLYSDYLTLEQHSPVRHEFFAGEIYAMAGGTPAHAALAAAILRLIGNQLPSGCRTYTSDLRVRIQASDVTTYPDGAVVCGKVVPASDDAIAVTNPVLLVEVTSPSTEAYDRGAKLEHYRSLPSLQTVLILSHREVRVDLFTRNPSGGWTAVAFVAGTSFQIDSFGIVISVDDLYVNIE